MKNKIIKTAKDLEQGKITETEAQMLLLGLFGVSGSFSDEENYQLALTVFEREEGRKPNMNTTKDMNAVAILEVGIRYARNYR